MGITDVPRDFVEAHDFLQAVKDTATYAAAQEVERARNARELPGNVLEELRRPFSPEAVKWKIQVETKNGAIVVAHLDARLVIERLNKVVGLDWSETFAPMSQNWLWCTLTVMGQSHTDCGTGRDGKAQRSDALKRAAVNFGIGVSIYAMSAVALTKGSGNAQLRTQKKRKQDPQTKQWGEVDVPILDERTRAALRGGYLKWITEGDGKVFGEPLSHGDQEGATGLELDVDEPEVEEDAGVEVVQVEGEQADELRQAAKDAFDVLRERGEMLPGEFARRVKAAGGSVDDLDALVGELVERAAAEPAS